MIFPIFIRFICLEICQNFNFLFRIQNQPQVAAEHQEPVESSEVSGQAGAGISEHAKSEEAATPGSAHEKVAHRK